MHSSLHLFTSASLAPRRVRVMMEMPSHEASPAPVEASPKTAQEQAQNSLKDLNAKIGAQTKLLETAKSSKDYAAVGRVQENVRFLEKQLAEIDALNAKLETEKKVVTTAAANSVAQLKKDISETLPAQGVKESTEIKLKSRKVFSPEEIATGKKTVIRHDSRGSITNSTTAIPELADWAPGKNEATIATIANITDDGLFNDNKLENTTKNLSWLSETFGNKEELMSELVYFELLKRFRPDSAAINALASELGVEAIDFTDAQSIKNGRRAIYDAINTRVQILTEARRSRGEAPESGIGYAAVIQGGDAYKDLLVKTLKAPQLDPKYNEAGLMAKIGEKLGNIDLGVGATIGLPGAVNARIGVTEGGAVSWGEFVEYKEGKFITKDAGLSTDVSATIGTDLAVAGHLDTGRGADLKGQELAKAGNEFIASLTDINTPVPTGINADLMGDLREVYNDPATNTETKQRIAEAGMGYIINYQAEHGSLRDFTWTGFNAGAAIGLGGLSVFAGLDWTRQKAKMSGGGFDTAQLSEAASTPRMSAVDTLKRIGFTFNEAEGKNVYTIPANAKISSIPGTVVQVENLDGSRTFTSNKKLGFQVQEIFTHGERQSLVVSVTEGTRTAAARAEIAVVNVEALEFSKDISARVQQQYDLAYAALGKLPVNVLRAQYRDVQKGFDALSSQSGENYKTALSNLIDLIGTKTQTKDLAVGMRIQIDEGNLADVYMGISAIVAMTAGSKADRDLYANFNPDKQISAALSVIKARAAREGAFDTNFAQAGMALPHSAKQARTAYNNEFASHIQAGTLGKEIFDGGAFATAFAQPDADGTGSDTGFKEIVAMAGPIETYQIAPKVVGEDATFRTALVNKNTSPLIFDNLAASITTSLAKAWYTEKTVSAEQVRWALSQWADAKITIEGVGDIAITSQILYAQMAICGNDAFGVGNIKYTIPGQPSVDEQVVDPTTTYSVSGAGKVLHTVTQRLSVSASVGIDVNGNNKGGGDDVGTTPGDGGGGVTPGTGGKS